jgi:hypothetical protein
MMNENEFVQAPQAGKTKKQRNLLIGSAAAVLIILCCCCVAVIALLTIDPFEWGLLSRLLGKHDPVAQAMPADDGLYVSVNLLNATPEKLDRIIAPFADAFRQASGESINTSEDMIDQLDEMLSSELGMTFETDIQPWIGQFAGMGITDFMFDSYGGVQEAQFFIAVEVRNKKEADAFLLKLTGQISDSSGYDFTVSDYNGVDVYVLDTANDYDRVVLARSGSLLLFGQDQQAVAAAIDAQKGDSLAQDSIYRDMISRLPKERLFTFYLTGGQLESLASAATASMDVAGLGEEARSVYASIEGLALSGSIVEAGVQFDSVMAYDLELISEAQRELLNSAGEGGEIAGQFPQETLAYVSGARLDLLWNLYRDSIVNLGGEAEYEEMISSLAGEIGFNPETDLLPNLDGEYAVGVIQSPAGMLAQNLNVDLGFFALMQTSDEAAVLQVIDQFVAAGRDQGAPMNDISSGEFTMYEVSDEYMGSIAAFGVGNQHLGIASSGGDLESLFVVENPLSDTDEYKLVWRAFSSDISPSLYLDVQSLIGTIREGMDEYTLSDFNEVAIFFEPIQHIAGGTTGLQGDAVQTTWIVFLP